MIRSKRVTVATTTLLVLALACFSESRAGSPNAENRPAPASVTTIGSMRVEAYGSGSPALVFIPGLACGSWVWDDAVRAYASTHAVYVVTLAGFDGLAAVPGASLDRADASLLELVSKLDRPIVIGHSLGGFLALRFGTEHAKLVRGIVSVDGLPVFPTLAEATPAQRSAFARSLGAKLGSLDAASFAAGQRATIATMVGDPIAVARVAALAAKSDPRATAAYASDLYASDIRPQLKDLSVPTLELAPVPTKAALYEGPQAATAAPGERAESYRAFYASLLAGAPNARVVTIADSLHFAMIDQPKATYEAITEFVDSLAR